MGAEVFMYLVYMVISAVIGVLIGMVLAQIYYKSIIQELEEKYHLTREDLHEMTKENNLTVAEIDKINERLVTNELEYKELYQEYQDVLDELDEIKRETDAKDKDIKILEDQVGILKQYRKDNLQLIKGIGPETEKKLNALGIFNFKQLAALDTEEIKKFEIREKSLGEGIRKNRWNEQAKSLIK